MKKVIRLTESDLHDIIKKSVNKILKEAEDFDADGLRDSLMAYIKNPVDINKDVDYDPSDDEVMCALDDLDLDTDFSDLMGGQYDESRRIRGCKLTEGRLRSIVKESIKKVLKEGEFDYVPSANDFEDLEDNDFSLDKYDDYYNYNNPGDYEPWMDEPIDDEYDGMFESKKMGKIIRESIMKALR